MPEGRGSVAEGRADRSYGKVNFVPILFSDLCKDFIPEPLRGVTHYLLDTGDAHSATEYSRLIAFLHGKAGVAPTLLGLP